MGFFDDVGGFIFGNKQDPGLLGLGQYGGSTPFYLGPDQGQTAYNQSQDTRNMQVDFIKSLQQQMMGTGPSVAQAQLQDATDRNVAQQMGLAASQKGVNPAIALRTAAYNTAALNQKGASDSAQLRNQEMLQGQNLLGASLDSARAGDQNSQALGVQQQTGINQMNQQAYNTAAQRRSEFISNIGQGVGSVMTGKPMADGGMVMGKTHAIGRMISDGVSGAVKATGSTGDDGGSAARAGKGVGKAIGGAIKSQKKGERVSGGDEVEMGHTLNPQKSINSTFFDDGYFEGGQIPGKAPVKGDSPKNDIILVPMSPGEIVIPRSHANDPERAKKFVEDIIKYEKIG